MPKIRPFLYLKMGCPWCAQAESFLQGRDIPYDKVNVLADQEAYQRMQKISGQTKTPTMEWGDEVLADFEVKQLEQFLIEHGVLED
jgi:glutaredoxin 3